MVDVLLRMQGIHKHFGRTHALRGVDFEFVAGRAHALLGENGSGKSTLMKVAYGEVDPDEGEVFLRGESVRFTHPLQATRAGVAMVAQEVPVVGTLSVAENIALGQLPTRPGGRVSWREVHRNATAALAELGSHLDPAVRVGALDPGDRQIVAIARALATDASVVVFDEPTSSLTAERADALFALIGRMKQRGMAIAFISQRLEDIAPVADDVTVLRDGALVATLPIAEADEAAITQLMVGRTLTDFFHRDEAAKVPTGERPVLRVRALASERIRGVDLELHPGEIVGVAGLVGSGRVEVVRAIFGAHDATGSVEVDGVGHHRRTPRSSIARGLAMATGDRKHEGLFGAQSVLVNLTAVHNNRASLMPMKLAEQRRAAAEVVRDFDVRPADLGLVAGGLSGGNQQKVVVGRWTMRRPRVMLLDEPTRGVDVGAKSEIYRILRTLTREGGSVLVTSSENSELLGLCDRILVMFQGRLVADLTTTDLDELTIAEHAAGVHHHV